MAENPYRSPREQGATSGRRRWWLLPVILSLIAVHTGLYVRWLYHFSTFGVTPEAVIAGCCVMLVNVMALVAVLRHRNRPRHQ
ncbi:MAG TPA: hypothetical protein VG826_05960 [Pirellulales bacterium]|nr:hypothetical protein [Pirellulales bacterium]